MADARRALVTDFDGTMTERDFFALVGGSLLPSGSPDHWSEYLQGRMTHFDALAAIYAQIRAPAKRMQSVLNQMHIDPNLGRWVGRLREKGWRIVVASAGCRWYIDRLLARAGVQLEVHANPGEFDPEHGLRMTRPADTPFPSVEAGVDKAAIVRSLIEQGYDVAYAGDGVPDVEPASLVPERRRFARGDLASILSSRGMMYHPFRAWSDVASAICDDTPLS